MFSSEWLTGSIEDHFKLQPRAFAADPSPSSTAPTLPTAPAVSAAQDDELGVPRLQRCVPVALAVPGDLDLPWLTADRAILNERLPASAGIIDVQLHLFAAVGTGQRQELDHIRRISRKFSVLSSRLTRGIVSNRELRTEN